MAKRKVLQIGDKRLKSKNRKLKNTETALVKKLVKDLADTMLDNKLVGISAPQIAENYNMIVSKPRGTKARTTNQADKLRVYINPKIIKFSKEKSVIYEGCGSVLNGTLFGPVTRSKEIIIEAYDQKFQKFRLRCDGLLARVIQHEYDHLSGIEFIEKVDDYKKLLDLEHYIKNIRNSRRQIESIKITILEYSEI